MGGEKPWIAVQTDADQRVLFPLNRDEFFSEGHD